MSSELERALVMSVSGGLRNMSLGPRSFSPEEEDGRARKFDSPYFTIQGGASVVSIFKRTVATAAHMLLNCIGIVSSNGDAALWDSLGRRRVFYVTTGMQQVIAGNVVFVNGVGTNMVIVMQSRESGIQIFQCNYDNPQTTLDRVQDVRLSSHIGFCRMQQHSNLFVLPTSGTHVGFATERSVFGAAVTRRPPRIINRIHVGGEQVMFLKAFSNEQGDDFLLTGTEAGVIKLTNIINVRDVQGGEIVQVVFIPWEKDVNLNDKKNEVPGTPVRRRSSSDLTEEEVLALDAAGQRPPPLKKKSKRADEAFEGIVPICGDVRVQSNLIIVGTNTRDLFIIKMDPTNKHLAFDGHKRLQNRGAGCLAFSPEGKQLAVGGWDGTLRVFKLPFWAPLATLVYHHVAINTICFFGFLTDEDSAIRVGQQNGVPKNRIEMMQPFRDSLVTRAPKPKKYIILCGSEDGQLSSWNVGEK